MLTLTERLIETASSDSDGKTMNGLCCFGIKFA